MIYDAHCHLDLMDNMEGCINEVQYSNLGVFAVGTTPKAYSREIQFCAKSKNIKVGLGMHPQLVSGGYDDMQLFKALFEKSKYIGEVGLDFRKAYYSTKERQMEIFDDIVKLCEDYGEKVVSIHSIKATSKVLEILEKYKRQKDNKYIFHWYTGTISQLERAIKVGCYFSINANMLKTKSGIEVVKAIPVNRILVETDAPFAFKCYCMTDIENELKGTMLQISNLVGLDMEDIICKNSTEVFGG